MADGYPPFKSDQQKTSPWWAGFMIVTFGAFAVVLVKEMYDMGHEQGWWT